MSRGYYSKACGRKLPQSSQTSIQFGLFCENKPSAAKSTGTVGKWGITSFTSIRSQHEELTAKRTRHDTRSSYNYGPPSPVSPAAPKPKKFFKSRNPSGDKPTYQPPAPTPPAATKRYNTKAQSRAKRNNSATIVEEDEVGKSEVGSPTNSANNPPIVLRIFKGTSQLLTEDTLNTKKDQKENERERPRRRSHSGSGSDQCENVSPKRHRRQVRDLEALRKDLEEELEEAIGEEPAAPPPPPPAPEPESVPELMQIEKALEEGFSEEVNSELLENVQENTHENVPLEPETEPQVAPNSNINVEISTADSGSTVIKFRKTRSMTAHSESNNCENNEGDNLVKDSKVEDNSEPEAKLPPVKYSLVNRPVKKGSIFKSRGDRDKRNALYKHKWCDLQEEGVQKNDKSEPAGAKAVVAGEFDGNSLTRVTTYTKAGGNGSAARASDMDFSEDVEPVTSVTCPRTTKEYYTVVRNVKKAHQIQESGEFQEFNDDVEYILDALQDNNPISTRCLSAISLASKCMVPAFRMHVRAHGTVTKFFRALHDAAKDQRLGMCTATVMFVLSQDRLNMDIERESLELMLDLLESDASHSSALEGCGLSEKDLEKTKEKVRSLCQEIQEQGHATHLNLDNITVGQLAMETLLSLTSKRAGEWFKEELRDLGGLEHIIKTVVDSCSGIDSDTTDWIPLLDRLRKTDRCLRVLENVTMHNEENSTYLLTYKEGILVDTLVRVYKVLDRQMCSYPTTKAADKESVGGVLRDCLMAILKVLIHLTHDYNNKSFGSALAGGKQGIIDTTLHILLGTPKYVPDELRFDLTILGLSLLINLVEHCESNRKLLIEAKAPAKADSMFDEDGGTAIEALITLFMHHEQLARSEEEKTDAILDGEKPTDSNQASKSHEEFIEETVALLLQKAGTHMEHTLTSAYVAILLGYLTIGNNENEQFIRNYMPDKNYKMMLSVLQKFFNFMNLTASAGSASNRSIKGTEMLIKHLTEADLASTSEIKQESDY